LSWGDEMIEIKNLRKVYRTSEKEIVALDGINLTIQDGEIFGIIGLSGAGKSTLVRCINLLERPSSGEVIIDGRSLTELPRKELLKQRREIGMIFQGFNLLEQRNVIKNICFPLELAGADRKSAAARAKELLKLVGLEDRAESYPSQLSGGQKQRVAIARALATKPKYLLCDEATSALDPNTTRQILDLLRKINQELGVTIVVITHEMRVIDRICDSVAVIDSSRIAELGKVSQVFTNPKSRIARDLIVPKDSTAIDTEGGRRIRLTFNGEEKTNEPFISRMVLECGAPVNILFADTRIFEGVLHGHMVVELPNDERQAEKIITWLKNSSVNWKEEI
jgi:D-methionine transport system ATP-binding protein